MEIDQLKVTYTTLRGFRSTAYLNRLNEAGQYEGTDKYTDHDVLVEASDEGWFER